MAHQREAETILQIERVVLLAHGAAQATGIDLDGGGQALLAAFAREALGEHGAEETLEVIIVHGCAPVYRERMLCTECDGDLTCMQSGP
jgi:hypothetical protein